MFGHLHPTAGRDQGSGCRDVERVAPVAAGAAGVHHVIGVVQLQDRIPQSPRARLDFLDGLAAHAHGGQGRADLSGRRLSLQAGLEEGARLFRREGLAVCQPRQQRLESVGHRRSPDGAIRPRRGA